MAKKYDDIGGVWRTIGGRRVFIKDGKDLASAMKESGKFKLSKKQIDAGNKLNEKAENGVKEDIKAFLNGKEDYEGTREEFIKDLSENWNVDKDRVEEILHDENAKHPRLFKNEFIKKIQEIQDRPSYKEKMDKAVQELNEKYGYESKNNNWQEQIKQNNAKMEKDVTDLQNKINDYRNRSINAKDGLERYQLLKEADNLTNQYYERFRENERANAKIKVESPNEKYMNVEAYAGYKDKFNETWGKDGSNDKVVSAKMYTNDEFMEHLEDANWHSERRQLLEANLTNQELKYIKDRTKVSAWGVENLTGKEQVDKLIKEAKSQNNSISNNLRQKAYQKYLKEHPASKLTFEQFKDMNSK